MQQNMLQNVLFPNDKFNCHPDMYVRYDEKGINNTGDKLSIESGYIIDTNTFYGSFSIEPWKLNTIINDLYFVILGKGSIEVSIYHRVLGANDKILNRVSCILSGDKSVSISIPNFESLNNGILYVKIKALTNVDIVSLGYATKQKQNNNIKLGIVITHFNRIQQVNSAVSRIDSELLNQIDFKNKVKLYVIDNSKNSGIISSKTVEVIDNKNLGGSGGFTRGLLELVNNGTFTHCLFMDDDASCEIESIKRTIKILEYSNNSKLAIAGSLLRELEPNRLFEKGAIFDGVCKPLKSGLDMLNPMHLLDAEFNDKQPNYGAWWYFCFPITEVERYPLPFFVRGDDISFSLSNNFTLLTINGIASFGDDFGLKSGPLPIYLDLRSHLVEQIFFLGANSYDLVKNCSRFIFAALFSYNYGSAKALCQAMDDFMQGPEFFVRNMDMQSRFKMNQEWSKYERMNDISRADYQLDYRDDKENMLRRILRIVSLNGNVLPDFFFKQKKIIFQPKGFRASFREVFLYNEIYYEYTPLMKGYVAKRNKKEFYLVLKDFIKLSFKLKSEFRIIKDKYEKELPYLMSLDFWNSIYNKEDK